MKRLITIVVIAVVIMFIILCVGIILMKKCKRQNDNTNKTKPSGTPRSRDDEAYTPQYHPKAEIGDILAPRSYKKKKGNQDDEVIDAAIDVEKVEDDLVLDQLNVDRVAIDYVDEEGN